MIDVNYFLTPKGKLNANWKRLIEKDPSKFDRSEYDPDLDDVTVLKLAIAGLSEMPKCATCGHPVPKIEAKYCSRKCSASDPEVKKKKLDAIDIEARSKKISEKLKGRNDYHSKGWDTRRELYGSNGYSESGLESLRNTDRNVEKARLTCIERYGVDNGSKAQHVREHLSEVARSLKTARLHLPDWLYDKELFTKEYLAGGRMGIVEKSGCQPGLVQNLEVEYGLRKEYKSTVEIELNNFIASLVNTEILNNTRKVIPNLKELDVYLPEYKLAIEYDGIYWHSSNSKLTDQHHITAHVNKTNECEKLGIQLLHIFENEWLNLIKRDIWKSIISHKLGKSKKIYARKCIIKDIDLTVAHAFCEENHLQGKCDASYAKGLFYGDELVQVATFSKSRFNREYKSELLRLCSKKYICVVGGASKLLKGMEFITYVNRRWSFGNVYTRMWMEKIDVTNPSYFYVVNGDLKPKSEYMKHMLNDKLEVFDNALSEAENCYANGLRRIWDCGNIVYRTK